MLVTTPVAALILIVSVFGLPIGLALAACYAVALFLGLLMTAFYVGAAEARLLNSGPIVTRGQHVWLLCAGVVTLAVLRSLFGGVVVFAGVIFGLGAVALWIYGAYSRPVVAASA